MLVLEASDRHEMNVWCEAVLKGFSYQLASAVFISVLLFVDPADAHSWYHEDCCDDKDCHPVDCDAVSEKPDGIMATPLHLRNAAPRVLAAPRALCRAAARPKLINAFLERGRRDDATGQIVVLDKLLGLGAALELILHDADALQRIGYGERDVGHVTDDQHIKRSIRHCTRSLNQMFSHPSRRPLLCRLRT
jgi:hypothetical protein